VDYEQGFKHEEGMELRDERVLFPLAYAWSKLMTSRYRVIIPYREPTYELYSGSSREKPYRASYIVTANSKEEALQKALDLFNRDARHSHVGWQREPDHEKCEVELI
jgi:hypothetical protein